MNEKTRGSRTFTRAARVQVAALLTFGVLAGGAWASGGDITDVMLKTVQLSGSAEFTGSLPESGSAQYRGPFQDLGPKIDVQSALTAVPPLLTAHRATMRMPIAVTQRTQYLTATEGEREQAVRASWAPSVASAQLDEVKDAVRAVAQDASYRAYTDNRFVVQEHQGASVSGDKASVLLLGYDEYYDGLTWERDVTRQWYVRLLRTGSDWQLLGQESVQMPEAEPAATDAVR